LSVISESRELALPLYIQSSTPDAGPSKRKLHLSSPTKNRSPLVATDVDRDFVYLTNSNIRFWDPMFTSLGPWIDTEIIRRLKYLAVTADFWAMVNFRETG
jgi:hypothetical protein